MIYSTSVSIALHLTSKYLNMYANMNYSVEKFAIEWHYVETTN